MRDALVATVAVAVVLGFFFTIFGVTGWLLIWLSRTPRPRPKDLMHELLYENPYSAVQAALSYLLRPGMYLLTGGLVLGLILLAAGIR